MSDPLTPERIPWRVELQRRHDIALRLELALEQLVELIGHPHQQNLTLDGESRNRIALVQFRLIEIHESIKSDRSLLDAGDEREWLKFAIGVHRFSDYFSEMRSGTFRWKHSDWWRSNKKYWNKFRSAACELREFIVIAQSRLSGKSIDEIQTEVEKANLKRQLMSWVESEQLIAEIVERVREWSRDDVYRKNVSIEQLFSGAAPDSTKGDNTTQKATPETTRKKNSKKRPMNARSADCARIYRSRSGQDTMKSVVEDYVQENGGSVNSIMRTLNDNPDQWKNDT
ncbi:MAG: hypothetical protein F9B45_30755 [Phycisphaera sp. RhM]|nr:hypothetical protein [Phycisphaera sp. RhM]